MINKLKQHASNIFSTLKKGDARSLRAKRHIIFSLSFRAFSSAISFLMVPILITYLGNVQYGIWITIFTTINMLHILDLGFGNGLRNNFAIAKAKDDTILARSYISTSYIGMLFLGVIIVIVFLSVFKQISWLKIFNAPEDLRLQIDNLVLIVFLSFVITFITKLIGNILMADQRAGINNSISPISNVLSLAIVIILIKLNINLKLTAVGMAFCLTPPILYLAYSAYFFTRDYKAYRPSIKFYDKKLLKDVSSLGIKFFIIQISLIVIMQTDNIIITQLFGPEYVTPYSNANKLFFFLYNAVFLTILATLWSSFTEAYEKGDTEWIKRVLKKLKKAWVLMSAVIILMIVSSKIIYRFWLGEEIAKDIPFSLSVLMGVWVIIYSWINVYSYFINGVGKIRIMLIGNSLAAILNIPLSIILGKHFGLGVNGVLIATIIPQIFLVIAFPIQVKKILFKQAKGIWDK